METDVRTPVFVRPYVDPMAQKPSRMHAPDRPFWDCKICETPWPCHPARALLVVDYTDRRVSLCVLMGSYLADAVSDMVRMRPSRELDTMALFDRFLAWTRPQDATT